ncbi:MAG: class I SAM-dependent methyltransferase [bacterium]
MAATLAKTERHTIKSTPVPHCRVCGAEGEPLYTGLRDRLFDAPGEWSIFGCTNTSCDLLWLNPMPLPAEIGKAYLDYYTHGNGQQGDKNGGKRLYQKIKRSYLGLKYGYPAAASPGPLHTAANLLGWLITLHPLQRNAIDMDVMFLPAHAGGRLLDIGSGSGRRLRLMQALGWQVQGIEVDPAAVARSRAAGLEVSAGRLGEQNFADEVFDAITMSHVIEHMHDPARVLRTCFRILKPGGLLVLATPNIESWAHRLYGQDWVHLDPPRHLFLFSSRTLVEMARQSGFRELRAWTTLQWKDITFNGSEAIKRTGSFCLNGRESRRIRFLARALELVELLLTKVRPGSGEELVLVAKKNAEP